jgi:hypothetical protein
LPLEGTVRQLRAIDSALLAKRTTVYNHVFRRLDVVFSRAMYAAALPDTSTIIWIPESCTELLCELSRQTNERICYVSVYEPMRARGFLCFENGMLVAEVFDPEQQIRSNTWSSQDLAGLGPRRFGSLTFFLETINPYFVPRDRLWSFERWENQAFREELLGKPDTALRWSVRFSDLGHGVSCVGEVPDDIRNSL